MIAGTQTNDASSHGRANARTRSAKRSATVGFNRGATASAADEGTAPPGPSAQGRAGQHERPARLSLPAEAGAWAARLSPAKVPRPEAPLADWGDRRGGWCSDWFAG